MRSALRLKRGPLRKFIGFRQPPPVQDLENVWLVPVSPLQRIAASMGRYVTFDRRVAGERRTAGLLPIQRLSRKSDALPDQGYSVAEGVILARKSR